MENLDLQILMVVQESTKLLGKSKKESDLLHFDEARDCCIKVLALLDLIRNSGEVSYDSMLSTCHSSLQYVSEDLKVMLKTHNGTRCYKPAKKASKLVGSGSTSSSSLSHGSESISQLNFDRVIGCELAKQMLYENIVLPLNLSGNDKSTVFAGIRAGTGNVLLHGPPGTGKTLLAQATAAEANAVMFSIRPSDVLSKYQGDSERYLRNIFEEARSVSVGRAIIFFDEFDSVALTRGGADEGAQARRLLSELLLQLTHNKMLQQIHRTSANDKPHLRATPVTSIINTGVKRSYAQHNIDVNDDDNDNDEVIENYDVESAAFGTTPHCGHVVVIAATNRLDDLDEAVLRRFESKIYVGVPDKLAREIMLTTHMKGIECDLSETDMQQIVELCYGWSGSDIETLCREAAMIPVRDVIGYSTTLLSRGGVNESKPTPPSTTTSTAAVTNTINNTATSPRHKQRASVSGDIATKMKKIVIRPVTLVDFEKAYCTLTTRETANTEEYCNQQNELNGMEETSSM